MKYRFISHGSALWPKIIGSYEAELHNIIENCISRRYQHVFDFGCAEGYYAIGFALRSVNSIVYAFDVAMDARKTCLEMADLNVVGNRIFVSGEINLLTIASILKPNSLIVCDCEGCEIDILDPRKCNSLTECDLLVEVHPTAAKDLIEVLTARFYDTHRVERIVQSPRQAAQYAILDKLPPPMTAELLNEWRTPDIQWLWIDRRP